MGKVLLTGGNGFVAVHILIRLLANGHRVVATVRSAEKGRQTLGCIPKDMKPYVTFAVIPDVGAANSFDQVIKENQFDGVIHTATPFAYNVTSPHDLFDPAVRGTENVLEAIHQYGPSVTRVIILSSCAAVFDTSKGARPGYTYSEADFNPITKEESLAGFIPLAYVGAKTHAEKTAWEFIKTRNPGFSLITLCPPLIFGPVANHVTSVKDLGTSNAEVWSLIDGSQKGGEIQPSNVWAWVDVRDIAEAHVRVYEREDLVNERFIITAGNCTNKDLVDAYRGVAEQRYVENLPTKLAPGLAPNGKPEGGLFQVDNSKSQKLLGLQYHTLEETLKAFLESIRPLEGA